MDGDISMDIPDESPGNLGNCCIAVPKNNADFFGSNSSFDLRQYSNNRNEPTTEDTTVTFKNSEELNSIESNIVSGENGQGSEAINDSLVSVVLSPEHIMKTWIQKWQTHVEEKLDTRTSDIIRDFFKTGDLKQEFLLFLRDKMQKFIATSGCFENSQQICRELVTEDGLLGLSMILPLMGILMEKIPSDMNMEFPITFTLVDGAAQQSPHANDGDNTYQASGESALMNSADNGELIETGESTCEYLPEDSIEHSVAKTPSILQKDTTMQQFVPSTSTGELVHEACVSKTLHVQPDEVANPVHSLGVSAMEIETENSFLTATKDQTQGASTILSKARTAMSLCRHDGDRREQIKAAGRILLRERFTIKELLEGNLSGRKSTKNARGRKYDEGKIEMISKQIRWLLDNPNKSDMPSLTDDLVVLEGQDWRNFRQDILVEFAGSLRPKVKKRRTCQPARRKHIQKSEQHKNSD